MPQRAVEQHHAAGRHGRGDGVIFLAVFRRGIEFVAARHDPRRAIVVAKIRQRPDRIDRDRDVRTRQRDQLRVFMDRLRLLAGTEHQRAERRQQAFPVQHALDHRQHVVVQRHFPEHIVIGEQIVDADGLEALERGFGIAEIVLALDARPAPASTPRPVRGSPRARSRCIRRRGSGRHAIELRLPSASRSPCRAVAWTIASRVRWGEKVHTVIARGSRDARYAACEAIHWGDCCARSRNDGSLRCWRVFQKSPPARRWTASAARN